MESSIEDSDFIEEDYDEKIRVMLIGDSSVGKTSLLKKYCQNEFSQSYVSTIGIDFQIKYISINNKKIKLQIWDTAGQERYHILAKNYFTSTDGFIIVYDITNKMTFDNVNNWVKQITDISPNYTKTIIFGNKCDLSSEREINSSDGKELAEKYKFKFYETSAKNGDNLNVGFEYIVKEVLRDMSSIKERRKNTYILRDRRHKNKTKKNESCC